MIPSFCENVAWVDFETCGNKANSTGVKKGRMFSKMKGTSIRAEEEALVSISLIVCCLGDCIIFVLV